MTEKEQAEFIARLVEAKYKEKPGFDWFGASMFAAVVGVFSFLTVGVWVSSK